MAQNGTETAFYDDNRNIDETSPEKEASYYKKRYEELQTEFEEYQYSSRELESELETQLSIFERRIRELDAKNMQLSNDNEHLRNKLDKLTVESQSQIILLQEKLTVSQKLNEQLTTHIRELEQSNDDLERAKRHLDATLSDFDAKLNEQIERNELLESEIGEKEELQVVIQRLKDEARDLRLELMIQQNLKKKSFSQDSESNSPVENKKFNSSVNNSSMNNSTSAHQSSNNLINVHSNTPKTPPSQVPLLSASSRISALNIVSDLLRKVGALESKLASCRNSMPSSASPVKVNSIAKTNNSVLTDSSLSSTFKD